MECTTHLRAFSAYFLCDLHLEQLQLDELYAVLRELKAGEISDGEAMKRLERSPYWVWTVIDPKSKLLVVVEVGTRTLAMAQRVVHKLAEVLAPGCVPLFLTDGFKEYKTAILSHFGQWMHPERRRDKGPMPKPREMPRQLVGEAKRLGFALEPAAARALVDRMGANPVRLRNELERLALWAGEGGAITAADLEAMVSDTSEAAVWTLSDALLERDPVKAAALAERLIAQGESGSVMRICSFRVSKSRPWNGRWPVSSS